MSRDKDAVTQNILLYPDQKQFLDKVFRWGELSGFMRFMIEDLHRLSGGDPTIARQLVVLYQARKINLFEAKGGSDAKADGD